MSLICQKGKVKSKGILDGNQFGFTLIELAIVLVIIGIILVAILKGQQLINNSKLKRMQNDLKGIEAMVLTFLDRKGRLPGDCDSDGIVEYSPSNQPQPTLIDIPSNKESPTDDYCINSSSSEDVDTPFSDLRVARVAAFGTPNLVLAKNLMGDFFVIGNATDNRTKVNVIIAYGIPAWMAKSIDMSIDGIENGENGKMRRWDVTDVGSKWPADEFNDSIISMAYFFDKELIGKPLSESL